MSNKRKVCGAMIVAVGVVVGCSTQAPDGRVGSTAQQVTLNWGNNTANLGGVPTTTEATHGWGSGNSNFPDYHHSYTLSTVCSGAWSGVSGKLDEWYFDDGTYYNFAYQVTLNAGSDSIGTVATHNFACTSGCTNLDVDYINDSTGTIAPAACSRGTDSKSLLWDFSGAPITAGTASRVFFVNTTDINSPTNAGDGGTNGYIFITGANGNCTVSSTAYYPG